jgi:hypothetical protein
MNCNSFAEHLWICINLFFLSPYKPMYYLFCVLQFLYKNRGMFEEFYKTLCKSKKFENIKFHRGKHGKYYAILRFQLYCFFPCFLVVYRVAVFFTFNTGPSNMKGNILTPIVFLIRVFWTHHPIFSIYFIIIGKGPPI